MPEGRSSTGMSGDHKNHILIVWNMVGDLLTRSKHSSAILLINLISFMYVEQDHHVISQDTSHIEQVHTVHFTIVLTDPEILTMSEHLATAGKRENSEAANSSGRRSAAAANTFISIHNICMIVCYNLCPMIPTQNCLALSFLLHSRDWATCSVCTACWL